MADGLVFLITELLALTDPTTADDGERFEWTSDASTTNAKGGARACPKGGPWKLGLTQHSVRTDYTGARNPSEQVLGPRRKPFTLSGRWQDKYNRSGDFAGGGYAEAEMLRFEKMVERGNRCRFQYGSQAFEGLITEFEPDYMRPWDIGYSFTVSVHNRAEKPARARVLHVPKDPAKSFSDADLAVQAMLAAHAKAPRNAVTGTLATDLDASLASLTESREALSQTIDGRAHKPTGSPVAPFQRTATQFRAVRERAYATLRLLAEVRADLDMVATTAIHVLDFEIWTRSLRTAARTAIRSAAEGAKAAAEYAKPDAARLYRPRAGESLYAIARKFYGTPHAWHLIYERNALRSFALTGSETLIIPARGGV